MTNEIKSNIPELSVSELAFSLKRTLEDTFGRVRVRGELSRVKIHTSGHMYSDLKDADAVLNVVCWKGTLSKLSVKPEEGLEVICTGKISSYPGRSTYQMIVDQMEHAGEGALLKMLEDRRKKLAAEGLFAADRKHALPFLPATIGVITSPTGAVIRDIMHRLNDRFPRHVLLWPVLVQGPGAAAQIAAAINGFSGMPADGITPRPDVIIVARGGGSLEDLMAFNEEIVVRAAADCTIPLISAVGHETDTTLIDFAADMRAPTPTAAAEMAVPRRADLMTQIQKDAHRLSTAMISRTDMMAQKLHGAAGRLTDPARLLELKTQKLDHVSLRLSSSLERIASRLSNRLSDLTGRLRHPRQVVAEAARILDLHGERLARAGTGLLQKPEQRLAQAGRLLETLSFKSTLARGFVVVRDENGTVLTSAAATRTGQNVRLQFADDDGIAATIGKK